uniref:Uncharacterized protein n=1 Tax=Parastrongyloides trichosuri TaxID=131310 RepID=A0A0N4ZWB5_PARTI
MKTNLKLLFAILFINILAQNQVKAWMRCWSGSVTMNIRLTFQTFNKSLTATVQDIDIKIHETMIFGIPNIYSILTIVKNEKTDFDTVIYTTGPTTPIYGFDAFGEVSYKKSCKDPKHPNKLCEKMLKFDIPNECLDCYGKPKPCKGGVNLESEISWLIPAKEGWS